MKKLFLLLSLIGLASCSSNECTEIAVKEYLSRSAEDDYTVIINEDTCINGDYSVGILRINPGNELIVEGNLDTDAFILFVGEGGAVKVEGDVSVGTNIFFQEEGSLSSNGSISIEKAAVIDEGGTGTIKYCDTINYEVLEEGVVATQECSGTFECTSNETLDDDGINTSLGEKVSVPCDFDYVNQQVKLDKDGRPFIYKEIN